MSAVASRPEMPYAIREFQRASTTALVLSLLFFASVVLASAFPVLRALLSGQEINPLVGAYVASCGVALRLVAQIEIQSWEQSHDSGVERYG